MAEKGKQVEPKPLTFERTAPEKPRGMSKAAQREWDFIVPQLLSRGALTNVDGKALAAYCDAYAMWEGSRKDIEEHGRLVEEPIMAGESQVGTRIKANPAIKSYVSFANLMKSYLVEFGLTPAARLKLKDLPTDEDPLDAVLLDHALGALPKDVRDRTQAEVGEA